MRLKTFGELKLEGADLSRPTPLLLLSYLAVEGKKPRRYLAELFYNHTKNKLDSLSQAFRQLKKHVEDDYLGIERSTAQTSIPSDINDFLQALDKQDFKTAIELYDGAFLANVNIKLSEELEEWVYGTREYLAARAREAFLQVAEKEHGLKNLSSAASYAERAYTLSEEMGLDLEPNQSQRMYTILSSAGSPRAIEVKEEAEGYGISVELEELEVVEQQTEIPHNLPPPKTSFIGRDEDLVNIANQLAREDCRLLTLHGMGGIGKSRLAIQAGNDQLRLGTFQDGICFVPLDALSLADLIPSSIAEAMGLELQGQDDTLSQVKRFIGEKHILLILDNYEHLTDAALLPSELLEACQNIKLIITSREVLNVEEEWVVTLKGLLFPTPEVSLEDAKHYEAVNLFVQRAKRAKSNFYLEEENYQTVIEICSLVEGAPLALELATIWIRAVPLKEIAKEIRQNLSTFNDAKRNVSTRHQSSHAVLEQSWRLLNEKERSVAKKLSVFRGGFTREAASFVAEAALPNLVSLVDKSLITLTTDARYEYHPMVNQFFQERLSEQPNDEHQAKSRHAEYAFDVLTKHCLLGENSLTNLRLIETEMSNILAAWHYAIKNNQLHLYTYPEDLVLYFDRKVQYDLGIKTYDSALQSQHTNQFNVSSLRVALLIDQAWLLIKAGRIRKATENAKNSLEMARGIGAPQLEMKALNILSNLSSKNSEPVQARRFIQEALLIAKTQKDVTRSITYSGNLAIIDEFLGNYKAAQTSYEYNLTAYEQQDDELGILRTLINLGVLSRRQRKWHKSINYYQKALWLTKKVEVPRIFVLNIFFGLAISYVEQEELAKAMRFTELALELGQEEDEHITTPLSLMIFGSIAASQHKYLEAKALYKQCLVKEAEIESHDRFFIYEILFLIAKLESAKGNQKRSRELLIVLSAERTLPTWFSQELKRELQELNQDVLCFPKVEKTFSDILTEIIYLEEVVS